MTVDAPDVNADAPALKADAPALTANLAFLICMKEHRR